MAALDTSAGSKPPPGRRRLSVQSAAQVTVFSVTLILFFTPLVASAAFGFTLPGKGFTLDSLDAAVQNADFLPQLSTTLQLAVLSTLASLLLLVPTLLFLHLRAPKLLPLTEWLSVIPYVVPAIALVSGANLFFRSVAPSFLVSTYSLVPFYVVLTLPLVYRTLDAGIRSLDIRTLFAASASLGATPAQTLVRIILPNLRAALLGASLLSCALALGEYALASLLLHSTFPVFMVQVGMNQPRAAAALSFLAIVVTWLLLMTLSGASTGRKSTQRSTQIKRQIAKDLLPTEFAPAGPPSFTKGGSR